MSTGPGPRDGHPRASEQLSSGSSGCGQRDWQCVQKPDFIPKEAETQKGWEWGWAPGGHCELEEPAHPPANMERCCVPITVPGTREEAQDLPASLAVKQGAGPVNSDLRSPSQARSRLTIFLSFCHLHNPL